MKLLYITTNINKNFHSMMIKSIYYYENSTAKSLNKLKLLVVLFFIKNLQIYIFIVDILRLIVLDIQL